MSRARDLRPSAYQNICSAGSPGFYQSLPYEAAGIGPRRGTSERIRCIDPGKKAYFWRAGRSGKLWKNPTKRVGPEQVERVVARLRAGLRPTQRHLPRSPKI